MPTSIKADDLVFLDFETNKSGAFYMMGTLEGDEVKQTILNEQLLGLAEQKGLEMGNPAEIIAERLSSWQERSKCICAFTNNEKHILTKQMRLSGQRFSSSVRYLDMHKAAKNWINSMHRQDFSALPILPNKTPRWSLISIMRLPALEFSMPGDYARGRTTQRFNTVIKALQRHNQVFSALTPVQKAKATKALKHNEYDLLALRVLFENIVRDRPDIIQSKMSQLSE